MRLSKLELFGFKSFFDKTVIHFKPGITAIVGPNGCGKSNLTDAILWVLGEQRPRNLRGEKMEDVIFNGTEHRKPLGMAEATLTLGDISEPLPSPYSPYSEITITRRLFRSGESEYLINQAPCRLKDIRDFLIDAKAGYRAHTVIEQGRIDELLTASPLQRRGLVEEVAGIAKYRIRKEESLRKLDATERNLVRIQDILSEVKRQINALDRQEKQARKYQQCYDELKSHELQIASIEWHNWKNTEESLTDEKQRLQETLVIKEANEATYDLKIAEVRLALTEKEGEIATHREQTAEVAEKIGRLEGQRETIRAKQREWDETRTRTTAEQSEIQKSQSERLLEQQHIEKELEAIEAQLPDVEQRRLHSQKEIEQIDATLRERSSTLEKERSRVFECSSGLTEARNNLLHFEARKEILLKKKMADSTKRDEVEARRQDLQGTEKGLLEKIAHLQEQWTDRQKNHNQALLDLQTCSARQEEIEAALYKVKEEWAHLLAKLAAKEGFYRGLLNPAVENNPVRSESFGFFADVIDVPPDYEKAIEAALGDRVRGVIVEDLSRLKEELQQIQSLKKGRGTFILRQNPYPTPGPVATGADPGNGIIGPAANLVSCKTGYEEILQRVLDGVLVVRDLSTAFELLESFGARNHRGSTTLFVTLSGEVIEPLGIVSAGEGNRLFEQKREIATLSEETARLQLEVKQREGELEASRKRGQDVRAEIALLEEAVQTIEVQRQALQKEADALSFEHRQMERAYETLLFEREEDDREEAALSEQIEKEKSQIAILTALKEEREGLFAQQVEEKERVQSAQNRLKEEEVSLQMQSASLKEKQRYYREKRDQTVQSYRSLIQRGEEKAALLTELQNRFTLAEKEEADLVIKIQEMALLQQKTLEEVRKKTEEHAGLLAVLSNQEVEARQARLLKDQINAALSDVAMREVEARMSQKNIHEAMLNQYQIHIEDRSVPAVPDGETFSLDEARQKRDALKASLNAIGSVHLGAIEEYQALTERHQFLKTQETDLITATDDLKKAIAKINQTTEGLFVETFHMLNQKFNETFSSFFGGGKAELILSDKDNPLESGIDIVAAPPGKKPRTLNLLSGGEKALTALSLLFSTFLSHTAPFCILDEVDAALDEENVRRFSEAIERLSDGTPFMVITHNKRTMEKANTLYGVTAEEAGVSKLVSVSLKEIGNGKAVPVSLTD